MTDDLSLKIRQAREDAQLSQQAMAVAMGVSVSTVVRYESGRTKRITADKLLDVARVTRKPLSYFLGRAAA